MDGTTEAERQGAFSLLRVLDGLGFGAGTLVGGLFLGEGALASTDLGQLLQDQPRLLFGAGAIVFALMGLLFGLAMVETRSMKFPMFWSQRVRLGDRPWAIGD